MAQGSLDVEAANRTLNHRLHDHCVFQVSSKWFEVLGTQLFMDTCWLRGNASSLPKWVHNSTRVGKMQHRLFESTRLRLDTTSQRAGRAEAWQQHLRASQEQAAL
jgi:hypothetical protein